MMNNKLKQAFRDAAALEFADIPTRDSDIQYEFSTNLTLSMPKLVKAERSGFRHVANTKLKRVAAIVIAFMLIGIAVFGIPPVRAAVVGFITRIFETEMEFSTERGGTARIEERYGIAMLPDGFVEASTDESEASLITFYTHDNGDAIIFKQTATDASFASADMELEKMHRVTLNGMDVYIRSAENCVFAIWLCDEYVFSLTCYGEQEQDEVLAIVESVERVELPPD